MTPKQILDSFSETLVRDERILSAQERSLIATLLQHARNAAASNPETQEAVQRTIASAIGETVAQRAFAVLGGSIVERILESSNPIGEGGESGSGLKQDSHPVTNPVRLNAPPPPSPSPSPQPQQPTSRMWNAPPPPSPSPSPQPQQPTSRTLWNSPPPSPSPSPSPQPQQPTASTTTVNLRAGVATAELPEFLRAQCVVLDEFLAPQELAELTAFSLEHEPDFRISEVISPSSEGVVDHQYRRSRVLMDAGEHQDLILERIKSVLPQVLKKLGMEEFQISAVEAQITASNDGDFFQFHNDNGSEPVASRHLTFVYFFHREPRPFEGGELRIHDAKMQNGVYVSQGTYQTIVPQANQIVFFPCELMHEITPVRCSSKTFADSRFTLNGWLRQ